MLAAPEEDGVALIDHLRAAERQTGVVPQILVDAPVLPAGCEELWGIFGELHSCRGLGLSAPQRITYSDIDSFQRVTGLKLQAWEIAAIKAADRAYLSDWAERQPK